MNIIGIIPARLKSERFPNKLLKEINGISILKKVIQNANKLNIDKLILISDSEKLLNFVKKMKNVDVELIHQTEEVSCGSERIKKVYEKYKDYNYYMSIPADEPFINVNQINKHIDIIINNHNSNNIYTFYSNFYSEERLQSPLSCKIIADIKDYALYFSRAIIPIMKDGSVNDLKFYKKHLGIFIFSNSILEKNLWNSKKLASYEELEQNIFLYNGYKIKLLKIDHKYFGVDTEKQINELEILYDYYNRS